jgi:hypothetical protein
LPALQPFGLLLGKILHAVPFHHVLILWRFSYPVRIRLLSKSKQIIAGSCALCKQNINKKQIVMNNKRIIIERLRYAFYFWTRYSFVAHGIATFLRVRPFSKRRSSREFAHHFSEKVFLFFGDHGHVSAFLAFPEIRGPVWVAATRRRAMETVYMISAPKAKFKNSSKYTLDFCLIHV